MFVLYTLKDLVMLDPNLLNLNFREAVTMKLQEKYVGKVLKNEGYGVCIYEM